MLINFDDFGINNLALPNEINRQKLYRAINEAENNDLSNYFQDIFLTDLKANYNTAIYQDVLNGKTWSRGTETVTFDGLKKALCYFAYSRLIFSNSLTVSVDGVTQKRSDYSDPADDKAKSAEANNCRQMGEYYIKKVIEFLNYNSSLYEKYYYQRPRGAKYSVIGD